MKNPLDQVFLIHRSEDTVKVSEDCSCRAAFDIR